MNTDVNIRATTPSAPATAVLWGWLGVVPFAGLAALAHAPELLTGFDTKSALISYGAIILTFMGGTHWGLAMMTDREKQLSDTFLYTAGIAPSLAAFLAALVGGLSALVILAAGFVGLLIYDLLILPKLGTPNWYLSLRVRLTLAVLFCLAIAATAPFI